jgi:hypothetical protein
MNIFTYANQIHEFHLAHFLPLTYLAALGFWIYATYFVIRYRAFARRYLSVVPAPEQTSYQAESLLHQLFQSVSPGCPPLSAPILERNIPIFWADSKSFWRRCEKLRKPPKRPAITGSRGPTMSWARQVRSWKSIGVTHLTLGQLLPQWSFASDRGPLDDRSHAAMKRYWNAVADLL